MANTTELAILVKVKDEATNAFGKINVGMESLAKVATGVGVALAGALAFSMQQAMESEAAQAQLQAALVSTGGAAGLSAAELNKMSASLASQTTFTDDAITGAQSMLLTFTRIGRDTFPQATKAVLDIATAMGGDLKGASIQLGKALNDPAQGLTALTRIGVSFTDQQKKQIETLQKSGKTMEAQKIILAELSTEFGGRAMAAAQTYEGRLKRLNNAFSEIAENVGRSVLPSLGLFLDDALASAQSAQEATGKTNNWSKAFYSFASGAKAAGYVLQGVVFAIAILGEAIVGSAAIVIAFGVDVVKTFRNVGKIGTEIFSAIGKAITGDFSGAKDAFNRAMSQFDFSTVASAAKMTAKVVLGTAVEMDLAFIKAGQAMSEGINQTGFRPIRDASAAAGKQLKMDIGGAAADTAASVKKIREAISSLGETARGVQEKLSTVIRDYTQKAAEQLDSYKTKIASINSDIQKIKDDFTRNEADRQKSYQDSVVSLYISQQDKLADLQKNYNDNTKKIGEESNDSQRAELQAKNSDISLEIAKQQTILAQFEKEQANIEKLASAERARTDLDRLKEKHLAEVAEADRQFNEKMLDLGLKLKTEELAYQQQKEALIQDTADKYLKLNEEVDKGWKTMLKTTGGHVANMKALETQVLTIKASIEAARATMAGNKASPVSLPRMAAGGIVTSPTIALLGEAGPEAVVPLSRAGSFGGASISISIGNFFGGNPEAAARELGNLIIKQLQLNARVG